MVRVRVHVIMSSTEYRPDTSKHILVSCELIRKQSQPSPWVTYAMIASRAGELQELIAQAAKPKDPVLPSSY